RPRRAEAVLLTRAFPFPCNEKVGASAHPPRPAYTLVERLRPGSAVFRSFSDLSRLRILQDERDSLARSDAHAQHAVAGFAQTQLGREREHVAGAGRPERMADGDRPAVRVQALVGNLEAVE